MSRISLFISIGVLIIGAVILFLSFSPSELIREQELIPEPLEEEDEITMQIISSAFEHNQSIPSKYTCDGENVNPPLAISGVPEGTQSLALIMDDPDAPAGTWIHWTVWNIVPQTVEIAENNFPHGVVQGMTSFGKQGYGGPCPPSGTHRYFFKLYALNDVLALSPDADKSQLEASMEGHIIDQVEFIGLYSRK